MVVDVDEQDMLEPEDVLEPRFAQEDVGYEDAARFSRDGYNGLTGRCAVVAALADLEAAAARQRLRREVGASSDGSDEVAASHAVSRGRGMRRWLVGATELSHRAVKFASPTDSERARAASVVNKVRSSAFAVNQAIREFQNGGRPGVLGLGAGVRRDGDVDDWVVRLGGSYLGVDKVRGHGMNMTSAPVVTSLQTLVDARAFGGLHVSQDCNTWSPALCLGTDGRPPIGQYRSAAAEDGLADLTPARKAACDEQNAFKRAAVALARKIHAQGGSVSFESSPDCKDSNAPWFLSAGKYNTTEHFSYWDDTLMRDYIRDTGSVILTLSRCAADPPVVGSTTSGYRKYMSYLLNPVAAARAGKLQKLVSDGCKHKHHPRLTGVDENGISHSRHAEQYPSVLSEATAALHLPAQPVGGPRATASGHDGGGGDAGNDDDDGREKDCDRSSEAQNGSRSQRSETRAQKRTTTAKAPPTKAPRQARAFLTCIVACAAGGPLVLLNDCLLPFVDIGGGAASASRASAVEAVVGLLPASAAVWQNLPRHYAAQRSDSLGAVEHIIAILAPAVPATMSVQYGEVPSGWVLAAIDRITDTATRIRTMLAVQLVADLYGDGRFGEPGGAVDGLIGVHDYTGVGDGNAPRTGALARFHARQRCDEAHSDTLRAALADEARRQAGAGDLDMAAWLDEGIALVRAAPVEEVGKSARMSSAEYPEWLAYEPFRDTVILPSNPLPQPSPQPSHGGPRPTSKLDIVDKAGLDLINGWFHEMLAWLCGVVLPNSYPPAPRPDVLVVGQDHFYASMRGTVWDCRREREGIIEPLDFTRRPDSQWNVEWLRQQLQTYPCRESVSHICDGADLKADLPLSFCFTPHLLSIVEEGAYLSLYADLIRLKANGWYEWFTDLPFAPWGINGQGSRPKPPDPVTGVPRFRRIVSGSDPHEDVVGTDGVPRSSVNQATRRQYPAQYDTAARRQWRRIGIVVLVSLLLSGHIRQMPWLWRNLVRFRKERKPRALDVMWDLSILAAIAAQANLPLFVLVDDFAEFFYQFRLASRCLWYCGIIMLDPEVKRLWCIVEKVLAMGFTPSSNIAQMAGEAFLYVLDALMRDADVVDSTEEAALHAIMAERARRHGGNNGRPRRRWIYTDDTLQAVIGTRRFLVACMQWRVLLRTARILAAAAHKRQLGSHCLYLGVRLMVTLGYATVPEVKLLKALGWITALRAGSLSKEVAKRLFGLLVHLVFLDATLRATTAGMWKCTSQSRADPVELTPAEDARAERWLLRLQQASAVQLNEAVRRRRRKHDTSGGLTLIGQSDAMRDSEKKQAAIGGYSHGTVWRLRLPARAAEILPISAGEFLAFLAHLVVHTEAHATATRVLHALDNINAMLAVARDSAKAPIMLALYDYMLALPAFQSVRHKLLAAQWFGGRLTMADAASRFYDDVLLSVAAALRITLVFVEVPSAVHHIVAHAVHTQERLLLLATPVPKREPPGMHGCIMGLPWQRGRAPQGALEIDARRSCLLGNMARHRDAAVATAAYGRVLEGVSVHEACSNCIIEPAMARVTSTHVAQAVSALALYVRAGGHIVLRATHKDDGHIQPLCLKVDALARIYLQRHAMTLQMAKFAVLAAGVQVVAQRVSRHRVFTAQEDMRGKRRRNTCESDGPKWAGTRAHAMSTTVVGRPRPRPVYNAPKLLSRARRTSQRPTPLRPATRFASTLRTQTIVRQNKRSVARCEPVTRSMASDVVARLANDKSPYALRPVDPGMLERLGLAVHSYAQFGANAATLAKEKSAWRKYWIPFTRRFRTREWRSDEAQQDPEREAVLQIGFAIDTWQIMKPRSKADAVAQVQSAFNVLGHIRRKHSRKGYIMPPPAMLTHVARGMNKEMLLNYGKHSAVPTRAEPFTADQNNRMLTLPAGTLVNGKPYRSTSEFWRGWRLLDTFANQTGERKMAIVGHELGEYVRSDVVFNINGTLTADPTPEQLRGMGSHIHDRIILRGGPSKADRDNRYFGAAPRVFMFNRSNTSNFAAALVDFELAFPVRGSARRLAPLFVQDGKQKRWTASTIDRTLDHVMRACLTADERVHKTFHSKRVWFASALKRNGHAEGEIQALAHWRSVESIRIYGRMDEIYQAECRERAGRAAFTTMNASTLPQVDPIRYTSQGAVLMPNIQNVAPLISAAA